MGEKSLKTDKIVCWIRQDNCWFTHKRFEDSLLIHTKLCVDLHLICYFTLNFPDNTIVWNFTQCELCDFQTVIGRSQNRQYVVWKWQFFFSMYLKWFPYSEQYSINLNRLPKKKKCLFSVFFLYFLLYFKTVCKATKISLLFTFFIILLTGCMAANHHDQLSGFVWC